MLSANYLPNDDGDIPATLEGGDNLQRKITKVKINLVAELEPNAVASLWCGAALPLILLLFLLSRADTGTRNALWPAILPRPSTAHQLHRKAVRRLPTQGTRLKTGTPIFFLLK